MASRIRPDIEVLVRTAYIRRNRPIANCQLTGKMYFPWEAARRGLPSRHKYLVSGEPGPGKSSHGCWTVGGYNSGNALGLALVS
jgi:hypothetical protein